MSTKPKILIVDDDPDLRRGLNLRLRANHYDTSYATDGFSAIAMAQKERPDLIILDIGLPNCPDRARSAIQSRAHVESGRHRFPAKTGGQ